MSFTSMHNDYLDPDRAGLYDEQPYQFENEWPDKAMAFYWFEDGKIMAERDDGSYFDIGQYDGEDVIEAKQMIFDYFEKGGNEPFDLSIFNSGDGAHCGLSDWYPEKEAALTAALESGRPFDTGWYASKKEIASARIWSDDGITVKVEVSVSDDFDTHGGAFDTCCPTLEGISQAIHEAWQEADNDLRRNADYMGYSLIHYSTKIPEYRRHPNAYPLETRTRYPRKMAQCLDVLVLPTNDFVLDGPPGDNYHFWGWQNDWDHEKDEDCGHVCVEEGIPKRTVDLFMKFALKGETGRLRIGDWELKSWEDGE